MQAPVYQTAIASIAVTTLISTRIYPFGEAPQDATKPYATYQLITGIPENYMDKSPDIDQFSYQIDCYSQSPAEVVDIAKALRDAFEPVCHVTAWRGKEREKDTRLYRYSFDIDWFVER